MTSVNKKEIDKFSKMANEWWDPEGKFKPLHKFNPIRIKYIKENIINSQTELKTRSQLIVNQALSETKQNIEKKEKDINQKLNEKVVQAEKQIMETQKLVIKEVISNAEELTAKVIQNLTDLKYDKIEGKKAINTASKNILVEK